MRGAAWGSKSRRVSVPMRGGGVGGSKSRRVSVPMRGGRRGGRSRDGGGVRSGAGHSAGNLWSPRMWRNRAIHRVGRGARRHVGDRNRDHPHDRDADHEPFATPAARFGRRRSRHELVDPARSIPEHVAAPFGNPADSGSPVALRPRLATGVLFRGGRPDELGQPLVHGRRIGTVCVAMPPVYRNCVRGSLAEGLRPTHPHRSSRPSVNGERVADPGCALPPKRLGREVRDRFRCTRARSLTARPPATRLRLQCVLERGDR